MSAAGADDTIFALSTPPGVGGIAVVRISGPAAGRALRSLTGKPLPEARHAVLRWIVRQDGERVDRALVLSLPAPGTMTGEEMVEIHCHGGRGVVRAMLDLLAAEPGLRPADPGEFTLRAFRNGRMDLTEVEALADLLSAETEAQRRQAVRGVSGGLRVLAESWRDRLVRALALVEVTIDWADEEVPTDVRPEVSALTAPVLAEMRRELTGAAASERVRTGFEVALIGAPNAGKSTLLNLLARREAALISPLPGTTRDAIDVAFDLDGLPVTLVDTAGLRDSIDEIEAMGIARAEDRARGADIRIALSAPDAPLPDRAAALMEAGDVLVSTKSDLDHGVRDGIRISAHRREGIDDLLTALSAALKERVAGAGLIGHIRQKRAVEDAATALHRFGDIDVADSPEIAASHLWAAVRALEGLSGRVGTEQVLDEIFGRFCLGK